MLRYTLILILNIFSLGIFAQKPYSTIKDVPEKVKNYFKLGQEMLFNKQPGQAIRYFDKALAQKPDFIDAKIFRSGALTQTGDFENAEKGFEEILALDADYDKVVWFDLGMVEFKLKKYDESGEHFGKYLETNPKNERRKATAKDYFQRAQLMAEAEKNPVEFKPKNLGPNINNSGNQYLPALTADGQTLIYAMVVGRGNAHEDFYQSQLKDGEWQKSAPIRAINTPNSEAAHTISADGKMLIFTACNRKTGYGSCDLFFTELKCGEWTEVKVIDPPVSSGNWESQPSLSPDGKTLFFASDRAGGIGRKDLWMTQKDENGVWGEPQNLGENINTPLDEKAPFIHPDGQTLYFLSMGHPGLGNEDIFISRKQPDGTWGIPKNFGYPFNTDRVEGPVFVALDGKTAWFSSNQNYEGAMGELDIYSFELPEKFRPQPVTYVKAHVKDSENSTDLTANIEFIDLATGRTHTVSETDCFGDFLVTLPSGKNYMLNIFKEGYLFHSENFELTDKGSFKEPFLLEVDLIPIPEQSEEGLASESKAVILKNVFFETGSAELKEASLIELNRLKTLLETNPDLKIQINGHTDNVGSEEDNLTLSNDRAKAVYDFLIENKIEANRLKFKGFGESMPIDSNETEAGRKNNRRTEFEVIR